MIDKNIFHSLNNYSNMDYDLNDYLCGHIRDEFRKTNAHCSQKFWDSKKTPLEQSIGPTELSCIMCGLKICRV